MARAFRRPDSRLKPGDDPKEEAADRGDPLAGRAQPVGPSLDGEGQRHQAERRGRVLHVQRDRCRPTEKGLEFAAFARPLSPVSLLPMCPPYSGWVLRTSRTTGHEPIRSPPAKRRLAFWTD
jgi:hypothetical protein